MVGVDGEERLIVTGQPTPTVIGSARGRPGRRQAATDPGRELEFGLARIIDGLLAYLDRK